MPRPEISEEVKEAVEDLTADDFNVPDHKVSFNDRLEIVVERLQKLQKQSNASSVATHVQGTYTGGTEVEREK